MIPCGLVGGAELGRSDGALGIESASLADVVPGLEGGDAVLFGHVVDGIEAAAEKLPPGGEVMELASVPWLFGSHEAQQLASMAVE